jgi:peptidyl-prolyl cis-trans isomerase A (cyclophilin A)
MKSPRAFLLSFLVAIAALAAPGRARAGTLVAINTSVGPIVAELYDGDKPVTTQNFLLYVNGGYYSNSIIHRLLPGFVVQGGGFYVQNLGTSTQALSYIPNYPPITNEYHVGKFYSNKFGTLAMAKSADPNSATSEFFVNLADNSGSLDDTNNAGGFTVFAHVISGLSTLTNFNNFQTSVQTNVIANLTNILGPNFASTPLLFPSATYSNLVYVNTTVFSAPLLAIIPQAGGGARLSWNSNSNLTYHVDRALSLPAAWQEIATAQGPGTNLVYLDSGATNSAAYYRIRVPY